MTQYWIITLLASTSVVITIFDASCLYFICKNKGGNRPSMLAIWNLLFCHLVQGVLVVPSYILKRLGLKNETTSRNVCDIFRFSYLVTNYLSCLSLLLITVDRMFAIKKPLLYRSIMTNRKMVFAVICCWIYTVVLCCIPFIPESGHNSKCSYNPQNEWTLVMLTCNTMLPFIVILYCYFVIFKSARSSRILRLSICVNSGAARVNNVPRDSEIRIAKVSSIVASAYMLCWGPSFIYYFLLAVCSNCFRATYFDSTAESVVTFIVKYLTFLNGIVAPIIYCYRYDKFKEILPFLRRNQVAPAPAE